MLLRASVSPLESFQGTPGYHLQWLGFVFFIHSYNKYILTAASPPPLFPDPSLRSPLILVATLQPLRCVFKSPGPRPCVCGPREPVSAALLLVQVFEPLAFYVHRIPPHPTLFFTAAEKGSITMGVIVVP